MLSLILNEIKQNDRNASKRFGGTLAGLNRCMNLPLALRRGAGHGLRSARKEQTATPEMDADKQIWPECGGFPRGFCRVRGCTDTKALGWPMGQHSPGYQTPGQPSLAPRSSGTPGTQCGPPALGTHALWRCPAGRGQPLRLGTRVWRRESCVLSSCLSLGRVLAQRAGVR